MAPTELPVDDTLSSNKPLNRLSLENSERNGPYPGARPQRVQELRTSNSTDNLNPTSQSLTNDVTPSGSAIRRGNPFVGLDIHYGRTIDYSRKAMAERRAAANRLTPNAPKLPPSSTNPNSLFTTPTKTINDLFAAEPAPSAFANANTTNSTPSTVNTSGFGSSPTSSAGNPFKDGRIRIVHKSTENLKELAKMAEKEVSPSPAETIQAPKKQSGSNNKRRNDRKKKRARADSEDPEASMTSMAPKPTMAPAPATFQAPALAQAKSIGKEKAKGPEQEDPEEFETKFDPFIKPNVIRIYIDGQPEGWIDPKPAMGFTTELKWQAEKKKMIDAGKKKIMKQGWHYGRSTVFYWEWETHDEYGARMRPPMWALVQETGVTITKCYTAKPY
ncbi:hypothetical protein BDZ45DRAFT_743860 [Acephala macrosclerotiorum]|nr:hypothetical protein BDZ45DRAFT_743860 [Acephala macrosclerotiorum]